VPNVTIIGAGPAGSTAAILLARRGWDVTLIEQHRFPRDKVCGECLSALGIEVLERAGLARTLRKLGPVRLTKTTLVATDGTEATVDLPKPMWGLSRIALDTALAAQAVRDGARIVQPARVESIDPATLACEVRDLTSNETTTFASEHVLVADGKASIGLLKPPASGDLGVKAHFAGVEDFPDRITLFGVRGHYVGLAPIEDGRWNIAMSVPAERVADCRGDFDAFFARLRTENRGLDRRFGHATRAGDWLASPLPRFPVAEQWPARLIPVGNAAAALEPIGGEGMGLAMRSAELAALELSGANDADGLRRAFDKLWRRRRMSCRAAAMAMSSPAAAGVAVRTISAHDAVARASLKFIGK
jgi:2-polyprenyl-6-methoxyphenol hydroxylase-like FAD-dependent oxidoreductase